jgi:hypothetical protein
MISAVVISTFGLTVTGSKGVREVWKAEPT